MAKMGGWAGGGRGLGPAAAGKQQTTIYLLGRCREVSPPTKVAVAVQPVPKGAGKNTG